MDDVPKKVFYADGFPLPGLSNLIQENAQFQHDMSPACLPLCREGQGQTREPTVLERRVLRADTASMFWVSMTRTRAPWITVSNACNYTPGEASEEAVVNNKKSVKNQSNTQIHTHVNLIWAGLFLNDIKINGLLNFLSSSSLMSTSTLSRFSMLKVMAS